MKAWITEQPDNNILETWEKWCTDNAPVHFFQHPAFAKLVIGSGVYQHGLAVALEDGQSWSAVLSYVILHEHGRAFRRLTTRTLVYGGPVFATDLSENEKSAAVATLLNSLNSHLKNRCLYIQFRNFSDHTPFEKIFASFGYRFTDRLNLLKPIEDPAQAFQALRIEVNGEMEALGEMLQRSLEMLKPGGRMSVISYHSLEDRMVKNFFRSGNFEGKLVKDFYGNVETPFELVNRKVIVPSEEEQRINPRSRSAKLRIAKKLGAESQSYKK